MDREIPRESPALLGQERRSGSGTARAACSATVPPLCRHVAVTGTALGSPGEGHGNRFHCQAELDGIRGRNAWLGGC